MDEPTIEYTGTEVCPKCEGSDISIGHDDERNVMQLQCKRCSHKWLVLPKDSVA
jgi:DNA-directed RNA polymerase subunit RPC12/RpoP